MQLSELEGQAEARPTKMLQKLLSRPDPVPQLPSLYRCHVTLDLVTDGIQRLELDRVFQVRPAHNVDF